MVDNGRSFLLTASLPSSVGIGSDFDGIGDTPQGLEDVSKYPALVSNDTQSAAHNLPVYNATSLWNIYLSQIAELYRRGWNKYELSGLTGANLLRVYKGAESVSSRLQESGATPVFDLYHKRPDLPTHIVEEL